MKSFVMRMLSRAMKNYILIILFITLFIGLYVEPIKITYILCGSIWGPLFLGMASFAISVGYWHGKIAVMQNLHSKKEDNKKD